MSKKSKQNFKLPNRDLTGRELKFGYWYVKHKLLFKRIAIGIFIAFDLALIVYGAYGFINHFFIEGPQVRQSISKMPENLIETGSFRFKTRPENIRVLDSKVISGAEGKYDFLARVSNPNPEWLIYFDYEFVYAGGRTETKSSFVLPLEDRMITSLGIKSDQKIISANLRIIDIEWEKVDKHDISDFNQFYKEHFNFDTENVKILTTQISGLPVTRVNFDITNNSAYSYWEIGVHVILYRGNRIAGINYIALEDFLSEQTRSVEVRWFEKISNVKIEIEPEVNILNPDVYMELKGNSGELK